MNKAIFKFNNGDGAILCNRCSVIVKSPVQLENVVDCVHLCNKCFDSLTAIEQAVSSIFPIQKEGNIGIDISADDLWDLYI